MAAYLKSNVFSDVYITGNCIIGGTVTSLANPVNSLMTILQDQKAQGTTGGTNGTGWQTRTLNTAVIDQIGVNLTTNQFTLPAGIYHVQISTPACQTNNHRCRLYNVTTSSTVILGTSECAQNSNPSNMSNRSFIDSYFTSASSGTYRIDQYFQTAYASGGLGMPSLSGGTDVEIYTTVKIIKINSGAALSQWTTSGTSLIYGSGNVGIGLTNPTSILNVNVTGSTANIYNTTSTASATTFYVNTADSRRVFVGMDGTGLFAFSTGALALGTDNTPIIFAPNYGSGEKMRILTTGYVGIGTTNPGSLLTVSGGVGIGSGYQTTLAPTNGLIVQGSVGIGTTNPGVNALQVTGNVVTQGFTSNSTNTIFNFDTLTVPFVSATQVGVGTTVPDNTIDAVGSIVAAPVTFTGASNYGLFFRRGFSTSNFYNCSVLAYDHNGDNNPDGISINGYDGVSICTGANTRQERIRVTQAGFLSASSSGTFTGVTSFDTVAFDLVNYNMVEIRLTVYFSTTNLRVLSTQLLDTASTVWSASETGWQTWFSASTAAASGTGTNIMPNTEIIGNAVGGFYSVIRLTGNQGLTQACRNHWDWSTVGCYAAVGATNTFGRATIYNTTWATINRMRFNLSGGTMTGKYSIFQYNT
jgi:hypothetical protein